MDKLILERAQRAVLGRDFGLAARLYKTLLKTDPNDVSILKALGGLYEKSGDDEKALPYYENILKLNLHDVDAMNSIGAIYRRLKQYDKSIEYLNRALSENKKTAMINYTLGFTYKDMGNYDDAIDCFENVVEENPTDVLAYNHLGVIYSIKKDYGKAVLTFQRGLQTDPNHPILRYNLGRAYEAEKNYDEAIKCYESALKTKPGWTDAIRDFVNLLLICKKTQRAYDVVQQAIRLHPTDADLTAVLGKVCISRYDFESAQSAFEKASAYKPDDAKLLIGKAESYERGVRFEEAALAAKQAYQIGLADFEDRKRYVHIMLSAGELKRADEELRKLYIEFPSDTSVIDLRAQYFISAGDEESVIDLFRKISLLNPNYYHHYLEAGRRFWQIRKYEKAIEIVDMYISKQPSNPAAYNLLGRIYEYSRNYEESLNQFEKACSFNCENVYAKTEIERVKKILEGEISEDDLPQEAPMPILENDGSIPSSAEDDFEQSENEASAEEPVEENKNQADDLLKGLTEDEGLSSFDEILKGTSRVLDAEKEEHIKDEMEFDPDEKSEPYIEPEPEPAEPDVPAPEPQIPPEQNLAEKLDDAMKQMEDLKKLAEEKAQEAMAKAEEAAQKAEEAIGKNQPEEEIPEEESNQAEESSYFDDEPQFEDPMPLQMRMRQPINSSGNFDTMFGVEPMFSEPSFGSDSLKKPLPFGAAPQGLTAADLITNPTSRNTYASAAEFLPNIVKMIENKGTATQYKSELDLFQKLRKLSDSLPQSQKSEFLSSKTRLLMDYVVAKMSGSPGLMTTVKNLLKSGILDTNDDIESIEREASNLTGNDLARKVVGDLKRLTSELEDQKLAQALRNEADKILEKL